MNDEANNNRLLIKLKNLRRHSNRQVAYSDLWSIAHDLAEDQFEPAIEYFVTGLEDSNWRWREDCIAFLGFHYMYLDKGIIKKFREMLLHDPESSVRLAAAIALGKHSTLPDQALLNAIEYDSNRFVRRSAFESILILSGIYHSKARTYGNRVEKREIQPTIETIRKILVDEGIEIPLDFLGDT